MNRNPGTGQSFATPGVSVRGRRIITTGLKTANGFEIQSVRFGVKSALVEKLVGLGNRGRGQVLPGAAERRPISRNILSQFSSESSYLLDLTCPKLFEFKNEAPLTCTQSSKCIHLTASNLLARSVRVVEAP